MRDDSQDDRAVPPEPYAPQSVDEAVPPVEDDTVDQIRGHLNRTIAGRPLIVYLVLFAGAVTLLLLLAIVWISATRNGDGRPQFCSPISAGEAKQAILSGNIVRMTVLVDDEDPLNSLTGMRLEFGDDTCREPQQGADVRDDLYLIIGAAEFYNTFGEQQVSIEYQRQNVPVALLSTSTPVPTATLPATETPTPSATPDVTATASPTETPTASPLAADITTPTSTSTPTSLAADVESSPMPASPAVRPVRTHAPVRTVVSTP